MKAKIAEASSLACKLGVLSREITAAAARLLEPFEITPSQANLFYYLLQGETSPSKIARSIGIDASSLSRLIRNLEAKGWIEREIDLDNRTRITLRLTANGERMARAIDPHAEQIQQRILDALDDTELHMLHEAIAKISYAMASRDDVPLPQPTDPPRAAC